MPGVADIITQIEVREGAATNDSLDKGGRTQFGISETANPEAWSDGKVTEEEARAIYTQKYVKHPKFDQLPPLLQPLCVDWGVVSGPQLVIMTLQKLLHVVPDGILGTQTFTALKVIPEGVLRLNNLLVAERIRQVGRIISKDPSQSKYVNGWLNRALEFLI